jgi:hypothetical protein
MTILTLIRLRVPPRKRVAIRHRVRLLLLLHGAGLASEASGRRCRRGSKDVDRHVWTGSGVPLWRAVTCHRIQPVNLAARAHRGGGPKPVRPPTIRAVGRPGNCQVLVSHALRPGDKPSCGLKKARRSLELAGRDSLPVVAPSLPQQFASCYDDRSLRTVGRISWVSRMPFSRTNSTRAIEARYVQI